MTNTGPKENYILSNDKLEKIGIVNYGISKTTWSIEEHPVSPTNIYLKGVRNTVYGINKFMVICSPNFDLFLYVIFDPQGRQEEVVQLGAQSLSIDGQTIPFTKYLIREPKIMNDWLTAVYSLPVTIIDKIASAETLGFMFQNSYGEPFFLGFLGMEFDGGRHLLRELRATCKRKPI